jgi:aldose 1-epimerase
MPQLEIASQPSVGHETVEGLEGVTLAAGDLEATFVPEAGLVGTSLRHDGEELLAREDGVRAYLETGRVMGIPFLHPWANRLESDGYEAAGRRVQLPADLPRDPGGLPIHGVLPQAWALRSVHACGRAASLVARLDFCDPAFPFPHRIEQRVTLAPGALRIETDVRATGSVAVPISFGFHPYLRLPGAAREDWVLGLPARRHLAVDERQIPTGAGVHESAELAPLGTRAFDDGYDELGREASFAIGCGGRAITVRFLAGYQAGQLFAPCDDDVICVEPMTAPANALVSGSGLRLLAPDRSFRAAFEIHVEARE